MHCAMCIVHCATGTGNCETTALPGLTYTSVVSLIHNCIPSQQEHGCMYMLLVYSKKKKASPTVAYALLYTLNKLKLLTKDTEYKRVHQVVVVSQCFPLLLELQGPTCLNDCHHYAYNEDDIQYELGKGCAKCSCWQTIPCYLGDGRGMCQYYCNAGKFGTTILSECKYQKSTERFNKSCIYYSQRNTHSRCKHSSAWNDEECM